MENIPTNIPKEIAFPRTVKSFVKRAGRITKLQQYALDNFYNDYALTFNGQNLQFDALFNNSNPIILEIGFGMGDSLITMAQANPQYNYLGIEVHSSGIGNILHKINALQIKNLKVIEHDAVEVIEKGIINNSLLGVQIFFPDPWHKKKHTKRRLIQKQFIQSLIPKIEIEGFIHIATDWDDYAKQILEVLSHNDNLSNMHESYAPRPTNRPLTKFEKRGQNLNHGVWDILFTKK